MFNYYHKNQTDLPQLIEEALKLLPENQAHRLISIDLTDDSIANLRRARHDFDGFLQVFTIAIGQWQKQTNDQRELKKLQQLLAKLDGLRKIKQEYFDEIFSEDLVREMQK